MKVLQRLTSQPLHKAHDMNTQSISDGTALVRARVPAWPHAVILLLATVSAAALAGPVRSVGPMTFVDADTVVVADWIGAELHALQLPAATPGPVKAFNLKDVSASIAHALRIQPDKLHFEDMAFRPQTGLAYIAVSIRRGQATPTPALVAVDADGKVAVVDLAKVRHASAAIHNAPAVAKRLWRDLPQATLTVTDLVFHQGKLYVAGLSNASFASTLRVIDYPFNGKVGAASIEMYHAVHNQVETRAPIRKMAVITLNGEATLLAAYTCTPLVTIPLEALVDGAHVTGKTIAELGWGSTPVDMVAFDAGEGPVVLLANSHKSADLMSVAAIADASAKPGLATPIKWPGEPLLGLRSVSIPLAGLAQLTEQSRDFLAALRRNEASGAMELVSIRKGAFLRLSDFVNEYDFADYRYGPSDGWRAVHGTLRTDEGYADVLSP